MELRRRLRDRRRRAPALRRGGGGPARRPAARLPRVLVGLAPPDPGARWRPATASWRPTSAATPGRDRPPRLARLPHRAPGRRRRRAHRGARARSARRRRPRLGRGASPGWWPRCIPSASSAWRSSTSRTPTRCSARCSARPRQLLQQLVHVLLPDPVAARARSCAPAAAGRWSATYQRRAGPARSPPRTSTATRRRCWAPTGCAARSTGTAPRCAARRWPCDRCTGRSPRRCSSSGASRTAHLVKEMADPDPRLVPDVRVVRLPRGQPLGPARRARARQRPAHRLPERGVKPRAGP